MTQMYMTTRVMRWRVQEMDKLQLLVVDTCDQSIALTVDAVTSDSMQTWDWGKVKKEENDTGVWEPQ